MSTVASDAPQALAERLPYGFVKRHGVILLWEPDAPPRLLLRPDASAGAVFEALRVLGTSYPAFPCDEAEFNAWLGRIYREAMSASLDAVSDLEAIEETAGPSAEDLLAESGDAPITRFLNSLIAQAIRDGASDLHIETYENRIALRVRVDGVLRDLPAPPRTIAPQLVSRVKVLARLDIAERRLPQDGRFSVSIAGKAVDLRVSTMPTRHGERVVLRLLDKALQRLDLATLGLSSTARVALDVALARPHGIVLVTGPTGSGKSTTLYACLQALNDGSRNILTVEDPIEYDLEGIGQTQVNPKAGLSFARGLRAILRQDPDVVMIGEIRDRETAEIAVQASLTGHLVLSTLHTNTALGAVARLIDMGIEPFMLGASLSALIAQRLVRGLCQLCRTAYAPTALERARLGGGGIDRPWYRPVGCAQCHGSGYAGRFALFEVVNVDERLREQIHAQASEAVLERLARAHSPSLLDDARDRVEAGLTSAEEAVRVTRAD